MKVLLISGNEHDFVSSFLSEKHNAVVANKKALALWEAAEYFQGETPPIDRVAVTDGGLSENPGENARMLEALPGLAHSEVIIVTRDFSLSVGHGDVKIAVTDCFRASERELDQLAHDDGRTQRNAGIFGIGGPAGSFGGRTRFGSSSGGAGKMPAAEPAEERPARRDAAAEPKPKTRKWGFSRGKQEENNDFSGISVAASKAVVFTGHRGAGATSTAVNTAITASRRGLSAVVVDLDVQYRSTNLYFGEFYKLAEEDEGMASSLIRVLAQPQSYQTAAARLEQNLWLAALGYGFSDERLLEQHFTETKIMGLITSLKHHFDLVAIDFPLDGLAGVPGMLNCVDTLALCMENSVYAAITTLRNIELGFGEGNGMIPYIASKSKLVVTKYNDESAYGGEILTPERFSRLIAEEGFCEDFIVEMPVAGNVPLAGWFGRQIESDIPVMDMNSQMKQAYDKILLRLY